jgi:phosphatidylserine/phosphatidylglycerophosphate/cardiolipin synthase-like enzyme
MAALAILATSAPLPPAAQGTDGVGPIPPSPAASFSRAEPGRALITRVYANAARDDEFVELANPGLDPIGLAGWTLTDREATATFPLDSTLPAGGRILVTRNATSYAEDTLDVADFTLEEGASRNMEGGVLRLADAGDEVLLQDPEKTVVDVYAWGDSDYQGAGWVGRAAERTGRGEIAVRLRDEMGAWRDRGIAEDWEGLRRHRLGQSAFETDFFELEGTTTAILSPDDGDTPLLRFLASAVRSIETGAYTLTSERIASVLADAARRGVSVRMLLDGGPVGGIEDEGHRILGGLLAAGVEVRSLVAGSDIVKRYRYLHAKYAIVDAGAAWIGSENFGPAGFSEERKGNRGWSIVVEDVGLATALREVFESDYDGRRRDSIRVVEAFNEPLPAAPSLPPWAPSGVHALRRARLVIAPDSSLDGEGVLGLIASARERLSIEAFYVDEEWRHNATNPFLEGAFVVARRGVSVRILLDGSWSSVGDFGVNDDILERMNRRARDEGLPLEVRLLEPRGRIERLHNKGVVADGRVVLVSSMNWALGSATENREIGVILEDPQIAGRFEAAFDADWEGRPTSGVDAWRLDDPGLLVGLYALVVGASALSLRKLRVGRKGIKPPAQVRTRASVRADLRRRRGEVRLLPAQLVAEPRPRAGSRSGARRGRQEARGRLRGPEGD